MRILHTVEFYSPSVGGMQFVVKQLSERLVKQGHQVTVATTKIPGREHCPNGVEVKEFEISGNMVNGYKGDISKYQDYLRSNQFDVVTNFAAQQWATDGMLPILNEISAKKVFVPTGFSGLYLPQYKNYFIDMKDYMKLYDMSIFLSDDYRDINFARDNGITKMMLIPNGAGLDEFEKDYSFNIRELLRIPKDNFMILNVGSHTGVKGHREAISIFRKSDIHNATLVIVGNRLKGGCYNKCARTERLYKLNPFRDKTKQLLILDIPREQTVAAYKTADLFLFTSNIECSPIVLFEAMAGKTPYLSTDVGNAKEISKWSNSGRIIPTAHDRDGMGHANISEGVKMLENIYQNQSLRRDMADRGYQAWKEKFTWEGITKQYEMLYLDLLKQ